MNKIYELSDPEYEYLCKVSDIAMWEKWNGSNTRTAFRNVYQWLARRGITEDDFWEWISD